MVDIESVQTITAAKSTDPRQYFRVTAPNNLSLATILQRRFHVVLCYGKASDEDSAWLTAGWIKESLGRALSERPLLAGRLRWRSSKEESDDHLGDLHVVTNDSGVRLIEGSMTDMKLDDFVGLQMQKRRSQVESSDELVFWEDLREQEPQFSPLFYVEVTKFSCDGYSIGISCSLLLTDPFALTYFLKSWANHHNTVVSSNPHKFPTFYHPKLGKPNASSPNVLTATSNTCKATTQTLVFQIPTPDILNDLDKKMYENLAFTCVDEAERAVGRKLASKFSLFVLRPYEDVKVEICSREEILEKPSSVNISGKLSCSNMCDDDQLELEKICFNEGNMTVYASCWMNSVVDEDSVIIVASDDLNTTSEMKILVTFA